MFGLCKVSPATVNAARRRADVLPVNEDRDGARDQMRLVMFRFNARRAPHVSRNACPFGATATQLASVALLSRSDICDVDDLS
jgi:hypothetical protein